MKTTLAGNVLAAAAMLLAACATAAEVQTTVDPQADLSRYRTFVFLEGDPGAPGARPPPKHDRETPGDQGLCARQEG
jgi:hypothetical protein